MRFKEWIGSFEKQKRSLIDLFSSIKKNNLGGVIIHPGYLGREISIKIFGKDEDYLGLLNQLLKKGDLFYSQEESKLVCISNEDIELSTGRFDYYLKGGANCLRLDLIRPTRTGNKNQQDYFNFKLKEDSKVFSI